ncbi:Protein YicC [Marinobacterium lacunae]|uniref:Protein YicC n=1 Tax=Marinobacterium lacunae TaxID=1232683 RepID=A0A081FXS8_9GAMM|nr:YicC/YloC family endoribonuclease [Marinobacterium lacunae]KEA63333.1 Protein YicC [Marinobacterium lacunae]MBR9885883.1 YicC family protein [Oceanospirillales bacterium]
MTRSMTAFARQELHKDWGTLTWEIRSVNHRYLEPHLRLPETLRDLEGSLREKLRISLSRGKVECTLRFVAEAGARSMNVDQVRAQEVIAAATQVRALMPDSAPLDTFQVLGWPGVLVEADLDMDLIKREALGLFDRALSDLSAGREREGGELSQLIRQRLDSISEIVAEVRALMPQILEAQRDAMRARIEEMNVDADPMRLEQELVLVAQRADVDEEMDRLDTHVQEVRRVLGQKGPIGRRLDFLMQELNREANTLSSKSIVASTTQRAVELKVLIEQMREQIQNIE